MLNEERIILMARMASYEKGAGRSSTASYLLYISFNLSLTSSKTVIYVLRPDSPTLTQCI